MPTAHSPQPTATAHSPQPTAHSPQPTAHSPLTYPLRSPLKLRYYKKLELKTTSNDHGQARPISFK
ncbi:MAG: hypothetical protein U7126_00760 [Microcoleus sp.]